VNSNDYEKILSPFASYLYAFSNYDGTREPIYALFQLPNGIPGIPSDFDDGAIDIISSRAPFAQVAATHFERSRWTGWRPWRPWWPRWRSRTRVGPLPSGHR